MSWLRCNRELHPIGDTHTCPKVEQALASNKRLRYSYAVVRRGGSKVPRVALEDLDAPVCGRCAQDLAVKGFPDLLSVSGYVVSKK